MLSPAETRDSVQFRVFTLFRTVCLIACLIMKM